MAGLLYVRTGNTGTDPAVAIDDLGITIATGASWTLLSASAPGDPEGSSGEFTARELRDSEDLYSAINTGALEWSRDGAAAEAALDYIADYPLFQDFTDDDLDLSEGRLTLPNDTSLPGTGREGETFWDSATDSFYVHDGSSFLLVATASGVNNDHGALTGLGDDDHSQYLLLSGNKARNTVTGGIDLSGGTDFVLPQATDVPTTFPSATEGSLAWDTDDEALYAHDGTNWFAIAPASGIVTDHGGLTGLGDDDHSQYALLAGNAARNPVTGAFDFTNGDLILPVDSGVPGAPVAGQVSVVDGILYAYDGTRSKWLSVQRDNFVAGKIRRARDIYLRGVDGIATSETGYRVLRDATITGLSAQTDGAETWTLEIRRNGVATPIASLTITAAAGDQNAAVNVDVAAGDELQFYANTPGGAIRSPIANLELAYRTA